MKLVMMLAVLGAVSLSACVTVGDDDGDESTAPTAPTTTDHAKGPGASEIRDEGSNHLTDKPPVPTPPGTCHFQCGGSRFVHAVNLGGYCREVGVHGEGVCWMPLGEGDGGGVCWDC